eukprot:6478789-Amphidinium_carterae.1
MALRAIASIFCKEEFLLFSCLCGAFLGESTQEVQGHHLLAVLKCGDDSCQEANACLILGLVPQHVPSAK